MRALRRSLQICAVLVTAFLFAHTASAQAVLQAGPVLSGGGHAPMYVPSTIGSQTGNGPPMVQDSGPAGGYLLGQGLSELLQVSRSPGTGPFASHFCMYDQANPATASHFLCFDPNSGGTALISSGSIGGAPAQQLFFNINGVVTPIVPAVSGTTLVHTTAQLQALGSSSGPTVVKDGYYVAGDMPVTVYVLTNGACTLGSGAGDGGSQIPAAGGLCWNADFKGIRASVLVFGAVCNNATDDAVQLQAAITWASTNAGNALLPAGTCVFKSPLTAPAANKWGIKGLGPGTSTLMYSGTSTTANMLQIGVANAVTASNTVTLFGFRVQSTTKMTSGDAIYLGNLIESNIDEVYADDQFSSPGGAKNLWNGFDFECLNHVTLDHAIAYSQNDTIRAWCNTVAQNFVDLYVHHTRVNGGAAGLHVAGGAGGVYFSDSSALFNTNNVLIDNALITVNPVAQQVIFGADSLSDVTSGGDGILVNMTTRTTANAQFVFDGWVSAAALNGIHVQSCLATGGCHITIEGHPIQFNGASGPPGDGVRLDDATAQYTIGGAIYNNNFNGINCTVPIIVNLMNYPHDNMSGGMDVTPNCSVLNNSVTSCLSNTITGTNSLVGVMAGLACPLAVRLSHAVRFTATGQMSNNTASDGGNIQIRYGTGTAPVNGAALTGTAVGFGVGYLPSSGGTGSISPFSIDFLVTGLTPGLNYWYDISEQAGIGGTVTPNNVMITAQEIK